MSQALLTLMIGGAGMIILLLLLANQNIVIYKPNLATFFVFLFSLLMSGLLLMVDWVVTRCNMMVARIRHTKFRAFTALSRLDKMNRKYFDIKNKVL